MKSVYDALIVVNEDGQVLSFNESAESFFKEESVRIIGQSFESLGHSKLFKKWLFFKSSFEDSNTYTIPAVRVSDDQDIPCCRVHFLRVKGSFDHTILYYMTVIEAYEKDETHRLACRPDRIEAETAEKTGLTFEDLFDLENIRRAQDQFTYFTGVASSIIDPDGHILLETSNPSEYCALIRGTEKGCRDCIASDLENSRRKGGPRVYRCQHGGLWDADIPIFINGNHLASWGIGQVRIPGHEEDSVVEYARSIGVDPEALQRAYNTLPVMSHKEFEQIVLFLDTFVNQYITIAYQNLKRKKYIEERREFVNLLMKREEYLQGILKVAPVGIGVLNSRRQLVQVNDRVCQITGYDPEELIHKDLGFLFLNEDEHKKVSETELAQLKQRALSKIKTKWRCKSGRAIDVRLSSVPMDADDVSRGYVARIQDITEEENNKKDLNVLVSAVENTQDSVLVMEPDGTILYANPAFMNLTGYSESEVIHQKPSFLNTGRPQDLRVYQDIETTVKSGKPWKGRVWNKKKDGSLYMGGISMTPVRNEEGVITSFVSVKRDITEQLRIEEDNRKLEEQFFQAQKEESIGRLAAGIAHDLNNLLSPILGYSEMLMDDTDSNELRQKRIVQIYEAGERARKMVKQLLTFSRKHDLEFRLVDLNAVITNFLPLLKQTIKDDISIELDLEPSLPSINADTGKIEQILMNLAVNAQDAMPLGGRLTIRTATDRECTPPLVMLSVTDTGCGIDEDELSHIFEPFFSTKGDKGTGLGLANVQRIIRKHKGRIGVSSVVNTGTTVSISLPSAEEGRTVPGGAEKTQKAARKTGAHTILLVEDDEQVRGVSASMLAQHGYDVLEAESAEAALHMAGDQWDGVSLLLTDMVLPGKNGFELYRRCLEFNPHISVLFMSGYLDVSGENEYRSLQKADFIQKPLLFNELIQKIEKLLENGPAD